MRRRDAIKAVTALAAGSITAGCDTPPPSRPSTASPATPAAPATPPSGVPSASSPATLPDEIRNGPRDRNNVALTFHGQGDPAIVGRLLDELAKGQAKVTVLAVGTWLSAEPELARRILAAGHELGNHTQHHADIKRMGASQARAEIEQCAQALKSLTGSIGRWFRPSQTQFATPIIKAQAAAVGYQTCLSYDVDSRDYTDPGAAAVVRNTLTAVHPGSIISLHFGHEGTIAAIAPLLQGLHERGLTPVTASELLA
jgi:peptidoglycan/xylan/chitin deacetylase (PgdA/CDA1 family)